MRNSCARTVLTLLIASSASAVVIDWTPIEDPGNACDTQTQGCFGAVGYDYSIGTYEVTNAQYTEFLNAKAASDPLGLYNANMGNPAPVEFSGHGGITRSGSPGSYSYSAIAGRENMPVNWVSFYDALRFANWMNNGQGTASTETGAYTITAQGIADNSITRNPGATTFLTSENEWYKAAYYDPGTASYFDYPAGFDEQTSCVTPGPILIVNTANCNNAVGDLTTKGSYAGSENHGTFDQGGNVWEWNEAIFSGSFPARGYRGGAYFNHATYLAASFQGNDVYPEEEADSIGFRVVKLPEPSARLLQMVGTLGLLGLAGWRRARD